MPNSLRQKAVYNIFLNFSIQIFLTKSARYFILSPTSFIKPPICAICISLHIVYFSQKNTPSFNGVPLFLNLLYHKPQCISKIKDFLDVRALHYHHTKNNMSFVQAHSILFLSDGTALLALMSVYPSNRYST